MLSLFGFGKRRRSKVKRSSKKMKSVRKPPSRLLKICKKYHVKATKKVGGRRVYKSIAVLKRMCLKKARAMKKKLMKMMKRKKSVKRKSVKRKSVVRRRRRGDGDEVDSSVDEKMMSFGSRQRIPMFGREGQHMMPDGTMMNNNMMTFGSRRRVPMFGEGKYSAGWANNKTLSDLRKCQQKNPSCAAKFGRRSKAKVSKAKAMKAFRSFWKRHCKGRGARFGNGGNPMLSSSMGYEFCPNGMGGVLGANSTGLFPSPCTSYNSSAGDAEMAQDLILPTYNNSSTKAAAFGKRRRRSPVMCRRRRRSPVTRRRRRSPVTRRRRRRGDGAAPVTRRRRRRGDGAAPAPAVRRRRRRCAV